MRNQVPTEKVFFIKSGAAFGCGYAYAAGEFGLVHKHELHDEPFKDDKGKDHVKKGLLSLGVVRVATQKEYDDFNAKVEADLALRAKSDPPTAASVSDLLEVVKKQGEQIAALLGKTQKDSPKGTAKAPVEQTPPSPENLENDPPKE